MSLFINQPLRETTKAKEWNSKEWKQRTLVPSDTSSPLSVIPHINAQAPLIAAKCRTRRVKTSIFSLSGLYNYPITYLKPFTLAQTYYFRISLVKTTKIGPKPSKTNLLTTTHLYIEFILTQSSNKFQMSIQHIPKYNFSPFTVTFKTRLSKSPF